MDPDYYTLLGITKLATQTEIKGAYKKLALELHPVDQIQLFFISLGQALNQIRIRKNQFQEMKNAYDTLKDPELRQIYDESLPKVMILSEFEEDPEFKEKPEPKEDKYTYNFKPEKNPFLKWKMMEMVWNDLGFNDSWQQLNQNQLGHKRKQLDDYEYEIKKKIKEFKGLEASIEGLESVFLQQNKKLIEVQEQSKDQQLAMDQLELKLKNFEELQQSETLYLHEIDQLKCTLQKKIEQQSQVSFQLNTQVLVIDSLIGNEKKLKELQKKVESQQQEISQLKKSLRLKLLNQNQVRNMQRLKDKELKQLQKKIKEQQVEVNNLNQKVKDFEQLSKKVINSLKLKVHHQECKHNGQLTTKDGCCYQCQKNQRRRQKYAKKQNFGFCERHQNQPKDINRLCRRCRELKRRKDRRENVKKKVN